MEAADIEASNGKSRTVHVAKAQTVFDKFCVSKIEMLRMA
eukprot:CAMPEP_0204154496 /NCGR_PEP_ID=MMETSP0361-20130328/28757_1 /ASSEMBLY_ACC=CAM_ASM_000343 /TAXON_ID=268821 /ORGANISM="Scrippsiella Hangoei, Strain SHTV-5" /LENGTH=39 /DNA_ID= /DNA_START= /DNA_END= /DNA_ORIENTATION=